MLRQKQPLHHYRITARSALGAALSGLALLPALAAAQTSGNPLVVPGLNTTQITMANLIRAACPSGINEPQFQIRCNNIVGAAQGGQNIQVLNSLQEVAPEQIIAQGTQGTRVLPGGLLSFAGTTVGLRLQVLRAGLDSGRGVQFTLNGQPLPASGGAAGADEGSPFSRLGAFVNVMYDFGEVDSTVRQKGFDYDLGGVTAGADYRLSDRLVVGGVFTYLSSDLEFDEDAGSTDSDSYSGSLYGMYYLTDRLYLDGVVTYGAIDYDTRRRIRYTIAPNSLDSDGDVVDTKAKGSPDGDQYTVSLGGGYDYARGALTVTPQARISYTELQVDSYQESGGAGWSMAFEEQHVRSLRTTLGAQTSYSVSMPWGVLLPQLRAEWHHEFKDDDRRVSARFLGDLTTGGQEFEVFTENPDRDYFNLGLGVSATLPRGISTFVDYNALLGYGDITSHQFVLGARMEF